MVEENDLFCPYLCMGNLREMMTFFNDKEEKKVYNVKKNDREEI